MSGAAGLSAAKRRRSQPTAQKPVQSRPNSRQPAPAPRTATKPAAAPAPQAGASPLQILHNHEQRLAGIESNQSVLNSNMELLEDPMDNAVLTSLSDRIERLEIDSAGSVGVSTEMDVDSSSATALAGTVRTLEAKLAEVKNILMKVQNFAMETNLTLLKYQNGLSSDQINALREGHARDLDAETPNEQHSPVADDDDDSEEGEGEEETDGAVQLVVNESEESSEN
jgi:hypothetical protein